MPKVKLTNNDTKDAQDVNTKDHKPKKAATKKTSTVKKTRVPKALQGLDNLDFISEIDFEEILNWYKRYDEALEHKEVNQMDGLHKTIYSRVDKIIDDNNDIKIEPPVSLVKLDHYLFNKNENSINFNHQFTLDHLYVITAWKLNRGSFRMKLAGFVKENNEEEVNTKIKNIYKQIVEKDQNTIYEDKAFILEKLEELSEIRGVGPATASAILSMMCPSIPFMSDEGVKGIGIKDIKYDKKTYMKYFAAIEEILKKYKQKEGDEPKEEINAKILERAFFSKEILRV